MTRVAIVEDDRACARQLEECVRRYLKENGLDGEIVVFPDGMDIAEDYRPVWDIILMDIEMPHLDGMSAARRIRAVDPAAVIMFITNMARYAIKGYEVDALDFVLKPVTYGQLALKLKKAMTIVASRERRYLMLPAGEGEKRVSTDEILFIEVVNHRLHIHTMEEEFVMSGSLQEMETKLAGLSFVRCSHSYMVNLKNVTGVGKETVQVHGHTISVSRPRRKEFLQRLSDYLGGGLR
ncbi:LytTR family DNA-binding domain-containing protein [Pseudoflavonifractor sp. CLA-AP-H29]|uniref:Stage 0 sporulation protein A homolog n=1 Tax=Pseudoflavonifractor intestinihominis TaxID=3133171 RepID=A0ABV1E9W7_9FIRM